jgi:nitrogen fixation protein FixH
MTIILEKVESEKTQSRKDGFLVLWSLLAFFAVFSSVNAFFVYKAVTTNTGVVVENAFEQGVHYNDIIAKAKGGQK